MGPATSSQLAKLISLQPHIRLSIEFWAYLNAYLKFVWLVPCLTSKYPYFLRYVSNWFVMSLLLVTIDLFLTGLDDRLIITEANSFILTTWNIFIVPIYSDYLLNDWLVCVRRLSLWSTECWFQNCRTQASE